MMDDEAPGGAGTRPRTTEADRPPGPSKTARPRSIQTATLGAHLATPPSEVGGRGLTRREWNGWTREQRNHFRRQVIASLVPPPRQDPVFYLRPISNGDLLKLECLTGLRRYPDDFVWRGEDPIVDTVGEALEHVLEQMPEDYGVATILTADNDIITIERRYGGS